MRRRSVRVYAAAIGMVAGLGLVGCQEEVSGPSTADFGKEREALVARLQKKKSGGAAQTAPAPSDEGIGLASGPAFSYNGLDKRDPFRSFLAFETDDGRGAGRLPTQQYEIDQYQLTGIVWGIDRPRALVQDPDGMGHVLELGTYIGKNWGKVTQINSGSVIITEEYQTIDGELVTNQIVLELPVDELTQ